MVKKKCLDAVIQKLNIIFFAFLQHTVESPFHVWFKWSAKPRSNPG